MYWILINVFSESAKTCNHFLKIPILPEVFEMCLTFKIILLITNEPQTDFGKGNKMPMLSEHSSKVNHVMNDLTLNVNIAKFLGNILINNTAIKCDHSV